MFERRTSTPWLVRLQQVLLLSLAAAILLTCSDQRLPTEIVPPTFLIADAAHGGANPDFFFLPPMVPDPSETFDDDGFDPRQSPVVEICRLPCDAEQPSGFPLTFDMTTEASEQVRVDATAEHYIVNWHTNEFTVEEGSTYRITVSVAGTELGFADVDVYANMGQAKNANTGESIALVDGRTLPIKFRIEQGAVFAVGADGGMVVAQDGAVTLDVEAGAVTDDVGITVFPATGFPAAPVTMPGSVFDFGPGGTVFHEPVRLTIRYDPALLPSGSDESALALGHVVDGVWTDVPGRAVDLAAHTVSGLVYGFSFYGVLLQPILPPPPLAAPLAFESERDGDLEIYSWDGTTLQQLTNNTDIDGAPEWLGEQIVFQSNRSSNHDIWVMDQDGSSPENLTDTPDDMDGSPAWSPDGRRIAFHQWVPSDNGYDIWVMNADGKGQVNLTHDPANDVSPAWSPDGTKIAFGSDRDVGLREVWVMNADGTNPTRLTFDEALRDGDPTWSPDGTQIAFAKFVPGSWGEIWVMGADGSNPHRVTVANGTSDRLPAWSPDGSQIVFQRRSEPSGQWDIWLTTPAGAGPFQIVKHAAHDGEPAWKRPVSPPPPLSGPLAFASDRDEDWEIFTWNGTDLRQITDNSASDEAPDWLGSKIVFSSNRDGYEDIWMMDADGGSLVNLTNTADSREYAPTWSPCGCKIAFVRRMLAGDYDIWVMNADGSGQVNLTSHPANDAAPAWSPDGSRIAFRSDRDDQQEIYVMNSDGSGSPTRLTSDTEWDDGSPTWSPYGDQIAFAKYLPGDEGEIWVMGEDGSNPHRVTVANGTQDVGPAWSPDGSQIVFQRYDLASGGPDLWFTTPDGSGPFPVVVNAASDIAPEWKMPAPPEFGVQETVIANSVDIETNPRLGVDATGEIVVFTRQPSIGGGYGPGEIWYQRLNPDGTPSGAAAKVSLGGTDDMFNDLSGTRIVYVAYDPASAMQGRIMLYDIGTRVTSTITPDPSTRFQARIDGDVVVWVEGQSGATRVLYYDLTWASGATPVEIGGPNPPATSVEIGSRYVIWSELVNGQGDITAYDRLTGAVFSVSADPNLDEAYASISGNWAVWRAVSAPESIIRGADLSARPIVPVTLVDNGADVDYPSIDGDLVSFESDVSGNLEIYLYRMSDGRIFQVTSGEAESYLADLHGDKVVYVGLKFSSTYPDVFVSRFAFACGGGPCPACSVGSTSPLP